MEVDKTKKFLDSGKAAITLNVGFIGAGVMATAIGKGLIQSGIINPSQIYVSAPSLKNLTEWKSVGTNTTSDNSEVIANCSVVLLAMKPQYAVDAISSAFKTFKPISPITVVSIMAGISIQNIKKIIEKTFVAYQISTSNLNRINVIRAMPNTPIVVGEGCTILSVPELSGDNSSLVEVFNQHEIVVDSIFSVNGICVKVDEKLINPMGALSGSGPAYVYHIIEALSDGAVKLGVPRATSYILAAQTLLGGAKMVLSTGKHPGVLKDEVCSPGGTTIAGISALEKNCVRHGLIDAVQAAYRRSEEIASQAEKH